MVDTPDGVLAAYSADVTTEAIKAAFGREAFYVRSAGGITLATLASPCDQGRADPAEADLLRGRDVLFTLRGEETAASVCDWLEWHHKLHGADAALVYCGPGPGDLDVLQQLLEPLAREMTIVLVEGDVAYSDDTNSLLELLRWRFLAEARAVAFLEIADLVLAERFGTVFDRAVQLKGRTLRLVGTEVFPRRLRRGKPACHVDHIFMRFNENRRLPSWCVAADKCPKNAIWRPGNIGFLRHGIARPADFRRAMGVARPGMNIGKLVSKSDLTEDAVLARALPRTFAQTPTVAATVRSAKPKGRQVTVVTTMKNEGPFIIDWIAHHRAIGIEKFLVYTNDCTDGTDRLLDLLADAGVTRRDNPFRKTGGVPQHAAFRAADTDPVVKHADWLLTLDVDEYLNIRAGQGRLSDLFEAVPDAGAISMPWRVFGNSNVHRYEDRPVTQQFHLCAPEYAPRPIQAWAFKTLYRNDGTFPRLGVHRPKGLSKKRAATLVWLDGTGRPFPVQLWRGGWRATTTTWGYDLVGVNHYAVRSAGSFLVKRQRGRVNHVDRDQGTAYWFRMNHNVVEDRSIRRFDRLASAERDRLIALPGVSDAHEASVVWHRDRIAQLQNKPDWRAFYDIITGSRMENLSRLTPNFGSPVFFAGPECIPDDLVDYPPGKRFFFTV